MLSKDQSLTPLPASNLRSLLLQPHHRSHRRQAPRSIWPHRRNRRKSPIPIRQPHPIRRPLHLRLLRLPQQYPRPGRQHHLLWLQVRQLLQPVRRLPRPAVLRDLHRRDPLCRWTQQHCCRLIRRIYSILFYICRRILDDFQHEHDTYCYDHAIGRSYDCIHYQPSPTSYRNQRYRSLPSHRQRHRPSCLRHRVFNR